MSHPGQLVLLPAGFVAELSKLIEPYRPVSRSEMVIPPGNRFAVLQEDFTRRKNMSIGIELKTHLQCYQLSLLDSGKITILVVFSRKVASLKKF